MSINDQPVRTREELIKGLLQRAFNGQSRYSVAEMQAEIDARLTRARDVPEGHQAILKIIRAVEKDNKDYAQALRQAGVAEKDIPPESRALRNLSIQERLAGKENLSYQTTAPQVRMICDDVAEWVQVPRIQSRLTPL
jgi:hypothetical protein